MPMVSPKTSTVKPPRCKMTAKIDTKSTLFRDPLQSLILKHLPYEITDFKVRAPPKNRPKSGRKHHLEKRSQKLTLMASTAPPSEPPWRRETAQEVPKRRGRNSPWALNGCLGVSMCPPDDPELENELKLCLNGVPESRYP